METLKHKLNLDGLRSTALSWLNALGGNRESTQTPVIITEFIVSGKAGTARRTEIPGPEKVIIARAKIEKIGSKRRYLRVELKRDAHSDVPIEVLRTIPDYEICELVYVDEIERANFD